MKTTLNLRVFLAILLAAAPLAATAQQTFFTDNFTSGSTLNGASIPGGTTNASFTSYDLASTKGSSNSIIKPGDFTMDLSAVTSSGFVEAQALFTTNAVALSADGDYIDLTMVFTNTSGSLLDSISSFIWLGLYYSGGTPPVAGALANGGLNDTAGSAYATGNCANWQGYIAQVSSNGVTKILTRPVQNGSLTSSQNQELLGDNAGTGTFNGPAGTLISTAPLGPLTLTPGGQYTENLIISLVGADTLIITNNIYSGATTNGTLVFSQGTTNVMGAEFLTASFDGFAIGILSKNSSIIPVIDINSIQITGQSTPITNPPTITTQPLPVIVATNGSCAFSVTASGFGLGYQWHRAGTNLLDGVNISGSTSSQLVISPAGTADVLSGANGYSVTVTGTGGYSTNSTTASLSLVPATNLVWSGNYVTWDLNITPAWFNPADQAVTFNFGDPVTINDTGAGGIITLTGNYLSAASVTVDTVNTNNSYELEGSGSFAGPGSLFYIGAAPLTIDNANTYSGGTLISNATADLVLDNYNGLGSGPVILGEAGGLLELTLSGGDSDGVNGDVVVADDFTIQVDGSGSYAAVFLGDLSGTAGKTLTFNQGQDNVNAFTNRIRIYGGNTVYDANMVLNGTATSEANYNGTVLAPYEPSGSQTYNGIISGNGGLIQRGAGTTILNGLNTYSGGTTPSAGAIGFGIDTVGNVTSGPIG